MVKPWTFGNTSINKSRKLRKAIKKIRNSFHCIQRVHSKNYRQTTKRTKGQYPLKKRIKGKHIGRMRYGIGRRRLLG